MSLSTIYTHALIALLFLSFPPAYVVLALQCGDVTFDPSLYKCYMSDSGIDILCPFLSGKDYRLCGNSCYSNRTYSLDPLPFTVNIG